MWNENVLLTTELFILIFRIGALPVIFGYVLLEPSVRIPRNARRENYAICLLFERMAEQ
jgi:hypothetical protein